MINEGVLTNSELLYSSDEIQDAIVRMSEEINSVLKDDEVVAVCVMNGAIVFYGQLITRLGINTYIDYVHATRYQGKIAGSELVWLREPEINPEGKIILIIDDILDEGYTLAAIVEKYRQLGAKAVYTAVLVTKSGTNKSGIITDFSGLTVPDKYVFGYGMDYKGLYRNLPEIYAARDL